MQTSLIGIRFNRPAVLKQTAAVLVMALCAGSAYASNTVFDQPDPDFKGRVFSPGVVTPGGNAVINGSGFKAGQEIQLLRSGQNVAKDQVLTAGQDGKFSTSIAIPADAAIGRHPIVVQVAKPSAAEVFELKVSPDIKFSGADKFTIVSERLRPGMYQSAYSAASNMLYVTSSAGRPPATESVLMKVDPDTLKIEASATAATSMVNGKNRVMAIFGVAVDDAAGTVWVTNTRDNTVAVYKQSDLSLVKQFEPGAAPHARDVAIDSAHHRAYVSAFGAGEIAVFDTQKLEPLDAIAIKSGIRGEEFKPMGLSLDARNSKLYTVSLPSNQAAMIDLAKQQVEQVYALPGAEGSIGVAVAPEANVLFVASQGSDNIQILDLEKGEVLHSVSVGASPLSVVWDAKDKLAYVISRGAGSIAVINLDGKLLANLKAGSLPNHLSTDGKGHIFSINKARGKDDETRDQVTKITLK
ncbi:YncE family protein [Pollutimonas harenae]|uniref:ATP-binding protein n=1 Tax=Pollutimonas harenae TaxID=657015 RepID=A0A853H6M2_9BURK|nr:ATP-binding protein [Pollutimonas harenae]NYT86163.1 ATP-binding protein [Pollutimonas harenae]TEA71200.1 ATP-binding protein [Pollutimonas harenae]